MALKDLLPVIWSYSDLKLIYTNGAGEENNLRLIGIDKFF